MRADPFTVLDISRAATFEEARAAYRRLAEIFHPDRWVDARPEIRDEAEKQMKRLNEAWGRLRTKLGADEDDPGIRISRGTEQATASKWARQGDDFGDRARHARNRERAQRRWSEAQAEAEEDRVRAQQSREAREREEFIRQARARMEEEESFRSGSQGR